MAISFLALLVLFLVPCCIGALFLLWRRAMQVPRDGLSRCGHCGYAVEGLNHMQCPECGSDFRKVGIVSPYQQKVMHPMVFGMLWALLLFPLVVIVAAIITALLGVDRGEWLIIAVLIWGVLVAWGVSLFLNRRRAFFKTLAEEDRSRPAT